MIKAQQEKRTCQCGSMITMIPWDQDPTVVIPVDIGPDPDGGVITTMGRTGLVVRFLGSGDSTPGSSLRAHWVVCPHQSRWHSTMEKTGHRAARQANRAGPCSRCGSLNPHRYGGPVASPLCNSCREASGLNAI